MREYKIKLTEQIAKYFELIAEITGMSVEEMISSMIFSCCEGIDMQNSEEVLSMYRERKKKK